MVTTTLSEAQMAEMERLADSHAEREYCASDSLSEGHLNSAVVVGFEAGVASERRASEVPGWIKNTPNFEPPEETFLIAVRWTTNGVTKWQFDKVDVVYYDGDGMRLRYCGGDSFDECEWEDVEYYMRAEIPIPPTTKGGES